MHGSSLAVKPLLFRPESWAMEFHRGLQSELVTKKPQSIEVGSIIPTGDQEPGRLGEHGPGLEQLRQPFFG